MKPCKYCGKPLPDDAHFCPYCAKTLTEVREIPLPKIHKRQHVWTAVIGIVLLIIAAGLLIFLRTPKTLQADGAEMTYKSWHLVLRNSASDDFHWQTAQPVYSRAVPAGTQAAIPLQLYVYDAETGENAAQDFLQALDHSEVEITAVGYSETADHGTPAPSEGFPLAALETDIIYDADCSENEIRWSFYMKNGDTITLLEKMEIRAIPEVTLSYQDTPLTTMEELQTLIDSLPERVGTETAVSIELAPVTYAGTLTIDTMSVTLVGTAGEDATTVISGTILVNASTPQPCTFRHLSFTGAENTGILGTESFFAEDCILTGLTEGILAQDGCWPMVSDCLFDGCRIGLHFDSTRSTSRNALYMGNRFRGNGTAVLLESIPTDDVLYFVNCIFEDNETDIENRTGNRIADQLPG